MFRDYMKKKNIVSCKLSSNIFIFKSAFLIARHVKKIYVLIANNLTLIDFFITELYNIYILILLHNGNVYDKIYIKIEVIYK